MNEDAHPCIQNVFISSHFTLHAKFNQNFPVICQNCINVIELLIIIFAFRDSLRFMICLCLVLHIKVTLKLD